MDSRCALRKRIWKAFPSKCAAGEMLTINCPIVSDLLDETVKECVGNPKQGCVKSGRWEKFAFEDMEFGLLVLKSLLGKLAIPTRKRHGYEIFIGGVEEIAYCKEEGLVRLLCVLGQEVSCEDQT